MGLLPRVHTVTLCKALHTSVVSDAINNIVSLVRSLHQRHGEEPSTKDQDYIIAAAFWILRLSEGLPISHWERTRWPLSFVLTRASDRISRLWLSCPAYPTRPLWSLGLPYWRCILLVGPPVFRHGPATAASRQTSSWSATSGASSVSCAHVAIYSFLSSLYSFISFSWLYWYFFLSWHHFLFFWTKHLDIKQTNKRRRRRRRAAKKWNILLSLVALLYRLNTLTFLIFHQLVFLRTSFFNVLTFQIRLKVFNILRKKFSPIGLFLLVLQLFFKQNDYVNQYLDKA